MIEGLVGCVAKLVMPKVYRDGFEKKKSNPKKVRYVLKSVYPDYNVKRRIERENVLGRYDSGYQKGNARKAELVGTE